MEIPLSMLLLLLVVTYIEGSIVTLPQDEKLEAKRQLALINKPATKSFVTKHGDRLDCVEIDKQLAFDHPLLKNHSIQMKPKFKVPKRPRLNESQSLPKRMRCARGTVLVKRIQEEDLTMKKFPPLLGTNFSYPIDAQPPQMRNEIAALVTATQNTGAAGKINLWNPEVKPDQHSDATIFVASDDGSNTNTIVIGWTVNPSLYKNHATRLYTYWTKDSGKSTGCYNALCPGFVQTSKSVALGQILGPISIHLGNQYFVDLTVRQDVETKNWWLLYEKENVGYWPKELFTTLTNGATRAGWGGEIQTPINEATPGMGSGHLAMEQYRRAALMKQLQLYAPQGFPAEKDLQLYLTKPKCYEVVYGDYPSDGEVVDWYHYIFFGGPPNCIF